MKNINNLWSDSSEGRARYSKMCRNIEKKLNRVQRIKRIPRIVPDKKYAEKMKKGANEYINSFNKQKCFEEFETNYEKYGKFVSKNPETARGHLQEYLEEASTQIKDYKIAREKFENFISENQNTYFLKDCSQIYQFLIEASILERISCGINHTKDYPLTVALKLGAPLL